MPDVFFTHTAIKKYLGLFIKQLQTVFWKPLMTCSPWQDAAALSGIFSIWPSHPGVPQSHIVTIMAPTKEMRISFPENLACSTNRYMASFLQRKQADMSGWQMLWLLRNGRDRSYIKADLVPVCGCLCRPGRAQTAHGGCWAINLDTPVSKGKPCFER